MPASKAAKRLQKSVRAVPRQCATQNSSGSCADHDEHHCFQVVLSEDRRHRSSTRCCSERKQPGWSRWCVRNRLDVFKCGADRRPADSTILDRRHCRGHTIHVHTSRTAALERNLTASAICGPQLQLFPVRNHCGSQTKLSAKPLGCLHRFVSRLPIGMQHMCAGEHKIASFKNGAIRSHIGCRTLESRGGGVLRRRLRHRFHQHDRLLEFVTGPERPVIQVAAWLTLSDEFACIKNSVVGLKPEMSICLPAHFGARTVSDEPCVALSSWNNQKSRNGIHSVSQTFTPLEDPIDGDSHTLRQHCINARVYVNKVDGAGASRGENAKIIALGE